MCEGGSAAGSACCYSARAECMDEAEGEGDCRAAAARPRVKRAWFSGVRCARLRSRACRVSRPPSDMARVRRRRARADEALQDLLDSQIH